MRVFPTRDHYYEPQFDLRVTRRLLAQDRPLPGIDWNVYEQMALLHSRRFAAELADTPLDKPEHLGSYLNKGVIVHIYDIFSPRNYPEKWLVERVLFWNEQYLLDVFLTHNSSWAIIGSLNYLRQHHYESLKAVAPFLTPEREPGSFYIQKRA